MCRWISKPAAHYAALFSTWTGGVGTLLIFLSAVLDLSAISDPEHLKPGGLCDFVPTGAAVLLALAPRQPKSGADKTP